MSFFDKFRRIKPPVFPDEETRARAEVEAQKALVSRVGPVQATQAAQTTQVIEGRLQGESISPYDPLDIGGWDAKYTPGLSLFDIDGARDGVNFEDGVVSKAIDYGKMTLVDRADDTP